MRAAIIFLALGLTACGAKQRRSVTGLRCDLGQTQDGVLVTEWSAAEKASLQTALSGGAVAVTFRECRMKLVPACELGGHYRWRRTTVSTDLVRINDRKELFAKVPLGAMSLGGELERTGSLMIHTTVAGERSVTDFDLQNVPRTQACLAATHVIRGLGVGAFSLLAGQKAHSEGGLTGTVDGREAGLGGRSERQAQTLKSAGDAARCAEANAEGPHIDCASPIQVFLAPIAGQADSVGPPGSARAQFRGGGSTEWDVKLSGTDVTCSTPCSGHLSPGQSFVMEERRLKDTALSSLMRIGEGRPILRVPPVDTEQGALMVTAQPVNFTRKILGLSATSFGGLSLAAGITLSAIGCRPDEPIGGLCAGGIGGLLGGVALLPVGIWAIVSAQAHAEVEPIFETRQLELSLGPAGVQGSF